MQEVEQTLGVLTFCVVSLVILQTRSYEQHATKFTMLQNDKYLCFYGSKCHKMFPLDQQYDARSIWNKKKSIFANNFCKSIWKITWKKRWLSALPLALVVEKKRFWILVVLPLKSAPRYRACQNLIFFFFTVENIENIAFENKPTKHSWYSRPFCGGCSDRTEMALIT